MRLEGTYATAEEAALVRARAVQHSEASQNLDDHAACEGHEKSQSSTSSTAHKVPHSSSKSGPAAPFAPSTPPQTTHASDGLTPGSAHSPGRRSRLPPQLQSSISNDPNQPGLASPTFRAGLKIQAQGRGHADPAAHVVCLDTTTQAYAVRKGVKNDGYRNSGGEVCAL